MAARKLQTEIDRTLKKVSEGVEQFEALYDKIQQSTNQTQKEKLEADLKTQIKKLQRLRDQIKTWLQSNEIKDKKALLDNRKLIETQMERFKACEKEMKTKAFSKEGLIAAARMDPAEKAKVEMSQWLSSMVDELARQVETAEAEIEQLQGAGKKSKKGASGVVERSGELEHQNERRNWHISRLEILLRMLENGNLETDRVTTIKDDIAYFVESNTEEDFDEDDGIYDEFDLDEQEENFGLKDNDDVVSSHDSVSVTDDGPPRTPIRETAQKQRQDSEDSGKRDEEKSATKKQTARKPSAEPVPKEKAVPPANFAQAKAPVSQPHVTSPPKATSAALPPIRYAAAAAAAVSPAQATASLPTATPSISAASASQVSEPAQAAEPSPPASSVAGTSEAAPGAARASPAPSAAQSVSANSQSQQHSQSNPPSIASTPALESARAASLSSGSGSQPTHADGPSQRDDTRSASPAPPGLARTQSPAINGSVKDAASARASPSMTHSSLRQSSQSQESPAVSHASVPSGMASAPGEDGQQQTDENAKGLSFQPAQLAASSAAAGVVQPAGGGAGTSQQQAAAQRQHGTEARLPSSLADLVSSFESAKQKSMRRDNNLTSVHKSLESSFMNVPEPLDSEKPKYYVPKNPFPTPQYYPQAPASVFDNPALYSKFDVDTLFYIFYYQQGTYHQYLAARELKKQSWRFHKQYLTWFQRHSEPQAITDEYEQGVYVYFDWEGSWCQRKKSDFRFEYRWLEEN